MPTSRLVPAGGEAPVWSGTKLSVHGCSHISHRAGLLSRLPAGLSWRLAEWSSPTRASTGSSTVSLRARRIIGGATTFLVASRSGAGEAAKGSPASFMAMRRPIAERPQSAGDRRTPGHWEADLMLFRTYGHAVLTMHERHSRILIAVRPPGKASSPIASAMSQVLGQLPPQWRRTVTFDNGTEFALHYRLHDLGIETFFCDTYSPWQKGGASNAIGRLRRTLPRKTDLAALPVERFTQMIQAYNNTPRKCLNYKTPAEIFLESVLHLKCESTFRPAPERRLTFTPTQKGLPGLAGEPLVLEAFQGTPTWPASYYCPTGSLLSRDPPEAVIDPNPCLRSSLYPFGQADWKHSSVPQMRTINRRGRRDWGHERSHNSRGLTASARAHNIASHRPWRPA